MTLSRFLRTLRNESTLAICVFVAVVGGAIGYAMSLPKQYTATTEVVVDIKNPDPIAGLVLPGLLAPGYMSTQVDIVSSQRQAIAVAERLGLSRQPDWIEMFERSARPGVPFDYWIAEALLKNVDVRPNRDSSVLSIQFTHRDPRSAAAIANAFADAYIATSVAMRVEPARQHRELFGQEAGELRTRVDEAQRRLSSFQARSGIVSTDEKMDVENAKLQELSTQLNVLSAQLADATRRSELARNAAATRTVGTLPDTQQNTLFQRLRGEQLRLEGRIKEQSTSLGPQHPEIVRLRQELESITTQVNGEFENIVETVKRQQQLVAQREADARRAYDRQRAVVMEIRENRQQADVLQQDAANAEKAYSAIAQRLSQASLESQATQANLFVLKAAWPPIQPSKPRILLIAAVAAVIGAMLAAFAAVFKQNLRRDILDPADLSDATGSDVLVTVRAAAARRPPALARPRPIPTLPRPQADPAPQ